MRRSQRVIIAGLVAPTASSSRPSADTIAARRRWSVIPVAQPPAGRRCTAPDRPYFGAQCGARRLLGTFRRVSGRPLLPRRVALTAITQRSARHWPCSSPGVLGGCFEPKGELLQNARPTRCWPSLFERAAPLRVERTQSHGLVERQLRFRSRPPGVDPASDAPGSASFGLIASERSSEVPACW